MLVFALTLFSLFMSCSSVSSKEKVSPQKNIKKQAKISQKLKKKKIVQKTSPAISPQLSLKYNKKHFKKWVDFFKKNPQRFVRYLKRGALYAEVVQKVFKEEGLPKDLFYVGLIESGFNLHARSHANAIGPWQFIKSTAKRYGLRVESQVDERKNIHKATKAAAHYFKDLYNIFGSWELALCAYNAGEYRVIGAIRKGNSRNYLTLARKKLLPRETIHYIPKLAAAHFLSQKDPFKNHLKNPSPRAKEFSQGEFFPLKTPFSIHTLAKRMRIKSLDLKRLNPDIKKGKIFPRGRAFRLVVPKNRLDSLAFITGQPRAKKTPSFSYKVKPGDNLISIAQAGKGESLLSQALE